MSKILLATEKPFTRQTVEDIKNIIEKSGNIFKLLKTTKQNKNLSTQ